MEKWTHSFSIVNMYANLAYFRGFLNLMRKVAHLQVVVVVTKAVWAYSIIQMDLYLQVNIIFVIYKSRNYNMYKETYHHRAIIIDKCLPPSFSADAY